jgi:hypothetical protein
MTKLAFLIKYEKHGASVKRVAEEVNTSIINTRSKNS